MSRVRPNPVGAAVNEVADRVQTDRDGIGRDARPPEVREPPNKRKKRRKKRKRRKEGSDFSAAASPSTAVTEATIGEGGGGVKTSAASGPATNVVVALLNLGAEAASGPAANGRGAAAGLPGLRYEDIGGSGIAVEGRRTGGPLGLLQRHQAGTLLRGEGEVMGESCCTVPTRAQAFGHGLIGGEEASQENEQNAHVSETISEAPPMKAPGGTLAPKPG